MVVSALGNPPSQQAVERSAAHCQDWLHGRLATEVDSHGQVRSGRHSLPPFVVYAGGTVAVASSGLAKVRSTEICVAAGSERGVVDAAIATLSCWMILNLACRYGFGGRPLPMVHHRSTHGASTGPIDSSTGRDGAYRDGRCCCGGDDVIHRDRHWRMESRWTRSGIGMTTTGPYRPVDRPVDQDPLLSWVSLSTLPLPVNRQELLVPLLLLLWVVPMT